MWIDSSTAVLCPIERERERLFRAFGNGFMRETRDDALSCIIQQFPEPFGVLVVHVSIAPFRGYGTPY